MKITISDDVLRCFRRRALRRYPLEYMETIWGKIRKGGVDIFAFHPIPHDGTVGECLYTATDIEAQRDEDAPECGLELLGTIHSHPDDTAEPSEADFITSEIDGDIISGICQIMKAKGRKGRKHTYIRFYSGAVHELKVERWR